MSAAVSLDLFRMHGGKVDAARTLFPEARGPWIDLSTGISPWPWSWPRPHDSIPREAFTRLPDPESTAALEAAAAASFNVADAARVVATPGSDLALRSLGRLFAGKRVAVVRPGYSGHVLAWEGAPFTSITADELSVAAESHDVVVLANPNNPDGRLIDRERLLASAGRLAERDGTLIVDEAFADVMPEQSLCDALSDERARRVIVFRSFGKFYGLAGIRLGFVVAAWAEHTRAFRSALGDWPVSGPAVALGTAAYRDLQWQALQRRRLVESAARLDALLTRAGLGIVGGTPLFRLARCAEGHGAFRSAGQAGAAEPERPADVLFRQLAAHGILTRPFSSDPTLVRFGLPGEESQWQRLAVALAHSNQSCALSRPAIEGPSVRRT